MNTPTAIKPDYSRKQAPPGNNNLDVALAYIKKYPNRKLFPCIGDKSRPAFKNNLELASNDEMQLRRWQKEHEGRGRIMWACSPRVSGIFCLDADLQKPGANGALNELVNAVRNESFDEILDTESASTPSGGLHLIFEGAHKFSQSKLGPGLDVPNYFMIPGQARGDGKRYTLTKDIPAMQAPAELQRRVTPPQPERIRTFSADPVPLDVFKKMLDATRYTGGPDGLDDRHSYGGWLSFLMAAHEAAGGEEWGYLDAVIEWSLADPNPDWKQPTSAEYIERKWQSFNADAPNAVTRASWFEVLRNLGRGDLIGDAGAPADFQAMRDDPSDFTAPANDDDPDGMTGRQPPPKEYPNGYSGSALMVADFPEDEEIIEGLILEGYPHTFDADGGVGKSLSSAQMAVHRVFGKPFLGRKVKQGPAIFITHEDNYNQTRKRMIAAAKSLGKDTLPDSLHVVCIDDEDLTIAVIDETGKWKKGPYYDTLDKLIGSMPGALVFLDCRSDFAQGDFIKYREVPNTFYKIVLAGFCRRHRATVVIICHPSKAATNDGSYSEGTTGNRTAVRRKLVMKLVKKDDPDGPRWFGNLKNQYGPQDGLIKIVYRDGIFVEATDLSPETTRSYEAIIDKVRKMIRIGITVVRNQQADGQGPDDIARGIVEDDPEGMQPTTAEVRAALAWGERQAKLRYVKAKSKIKAHYEVIEPGDVFRDD